MAHIVPSYYSVPGTRLMFELVPHYEVRTPVTRPPPRPSPPRSSLAPSQFILTADETESYLETLALRREVDEVTFREDGFVDTEIRAIRQRAKISATLIEEDEYELIHQSGADHRVANHERARSVALAERSMDPLVTIAMDWTEPLDVRGASVQGARLSPRESDDLAPPSTLAYPDDDPLTVSALKSSQGSYSSRLHRIQAASTVASRSYVKIGGRCFSVSDIAEKTNRMRLRGLTSPTQIETDQRAPKRGQRAILSFDPVLVQQFRKSQSNCPVRAPLRARRQVETPCSLSLNVQGSTYTSSDPTLERRSQSVSGGRERQFPSVSSPSSFQLRPLPNSLSPHSFVLRGEAISQQKRRLASKNS
ncbi:hypothetical protein GMRT_14661 [Giardia muris]|uniref:Uncharacterized protein n=1 Tax=Giardia muris TaxID=5742 RepID=A0A4Z1SLB0_GIAMU|nr:hypothetical protein GMRT_14661 [Giardia muris]|eukprot:TNJ26424.1 hypothetical protein GMRT_14661 [Giardia muris]